MLQKLFFADEADSTLPKYQRLADCLELWLKDSGFAPGTKIPGDRELARHLNTTVVTLAKSLKILSERNLVERRIGSGTFVADHIHQCKSNLRIGIVCHEIIQADQAYVTPVMEYLHKFWKDRNCQLVSFVGEPQDYENLIHEYSLAGLISFVPRESYRTELAALWQRGVPLVSIGIEFPELPEISFGSNHEWIVFDAIKYLTGLGHRKIGIIYERNSSSGLMRLQSFQRAMYSAGLPVNPEWCIDHDTGMTQNLENVIKAHGTPSAWLVYVPLQMPLIYEVMHRFGLRIPEDVSLLGFHDSPFFQYLNPPLTVIRQRIKEFTLLAASQLEHIITCKTPMKINERFNGGVLIERLSCASANNQQATTNNQPQKQEDLQ